MKKNHRFEFVSSGAQMTVPTCEAWLYEDKKALVSIQRGLKQAARGKTLRLGSFAKFAQG
jgi:hypothetical protein